MGARRMATIALSGALVVGGAGAAIAAVTKDDGRKAEQAILDDAAKRLDVTPEKLRDALAAAQDAQLDRAVEDGKLTRKQADAIKQARTQSGHVLGPVGPPLLHRRFEGPARPGFGLAIGPRGVFADIAEALGTTPRKLRQSLHDGKTLAEIAKADGRTLAEVIAAVKASAKTRLDKAVADDDLTRKQADEILAHVDDAVRMLWSGRPPRFRHRHGGPHVMPAPGVMPAPPAIRPGAFGPDDELELPAPPPGGTFY